MEPIICPQFCFRLRYCHLTVDIVERRQLEQVNTLKLYDETKGHRIAIAFRIVAPLSLFDLHNGGDVKGA